MTLPSHIGEPAGLLTAAFWTVSALAFERATNRAGTLAVNVIRLILGFFLLAALGFFTRGLWFPSDAGSEAWFWLCLSGIVGFTIGDLFLFASFTLLTSRISMLIMTLAPPMAAILSRFVLNESMSWLSILGMILVIGGISLVIMSKPENERGLKLKFSLKGLIFAFIAAAGQAGGLVLSKIGMKEYDPFAASQIRIIAGTVGFLIIVLVLNRWYRIGNALKDRKAMLSTSLGAVFGPFLGVSFSLIAIQHTNTGVAATLMSIVPVLIIIPTVLIYKQKVTAKEIIGAFISVCGVALFFV